MCRITVITGEPSVCLSNPTSQRDVSC